LDLADAFFDEAAFFTVDFFFLEADFPAVDLIRLSLPI
jgi:hypothetical protein